MTQVLLPSLWSRDDGVEVREDGFLWIRQYVDKTDEEQPLLLHSTDVLLHALYPSMKKPLFLQESGYLVEEACKQNEPSEASRDEDTVMEDDTLQKESSSDAIDNGKEGAARSVGNSIETENSDDGLSGDEENTENNVTSPINASKETSKLEAGEKEAANGSSTPQEYKVYQSLTRDTSIANRIQSALLDIQYLRHRVKRDRDRERLPRNEARVRALEHQQERLLSQKQGEDAASPDGSDEASEGEDNENVRESDAIRLVRTINSIRALFPHLLPILNHPRRTDKRLVIGKNRWRTKKKPMCWLLGTRVFDSTTAKLCDTAYWDARGILEGFLETKVAVKVSEDPCGGQVYWRKSWIIDILTKAMPNVSNPLAILGEGGEDLDTIEANANSLDEEFLDRGHSDQPDTKQRYQNSIKQLHKRLTTLLTKRFPKARLSIYGSCLSDLSLGQSSDVDLSLWLPEAAELKSGFQKGSIEASRYEKEMKRIVYQACRKLENVQNEFRGMQPVSRARVPVVKGTYCAADNPYSPDGSINFDICFLNDIAVANSSLIREYSLVDSRVKDLMLSVKRWAKEYNINSARENCISSYAWINLVIFYLQCLDFVPNLQCPKLMETVGITPDPNNFWHVVNNLDTCTLRWSQVQDSNAWQQPTELLHVPVSGLLYGFFEFYSRRFPSATYAISMKRGNISLPKLAFRKCSLFFCIEDPFETFDSYCPHDLGTPANEHGVKDIIQFLHEGEEHLRGILLGKSPISNGLWGKPPFVEPQPPRQGQKNGKFMRFGPAQNDAYRSRNQQKPAEITNIQPATTSPNFDNKVEKDNRPNGNSGQHSRQAPGQATKQQRSKNNRWRKKPPPKHGKGKQQNKANQKSQPDNATGTNHSPGQAKNQDKDTDRKPGNQGKQRSKYPSRHRKQARSQAQTAES